MIRGIMILNLKPLTPPRIRLRRVSAVSLLWYLHDVRASRALGFLAPTGGRDLQFIVALLATESNEHRFSRLMNDYLEGLIQHSTAEKPNSLPPKQPRTKSQTVLHR